MRHPIDAAIMFTALWVLASMTLDILTPKELTAVMIGAAIAPAMLLTALLYVLRYPLVDFTIMFATLWLIAAMSIELISPAQLSPLMIIGAFVPALIVGSWLHFWPKIRKIAAERSATVKAPPGQLGTKPP
ncbi:hypothetical protein [Bradyrhizobium sp.]|uniref:hypothetical protein n=1 Tax=Bradyrhizobium sp. TaxID=376 RepID=UPI0025C0DBEE|nr:hypothetical protein [Bradyrhizobium sp.]